MSNYSEMFFYRTVTQAVIKNIWAAKLARQILLYRLHLDDPEVSELETADLDRWAFLIASQADLHGISLRAVEDMIA